MGSKIAGSLATESKFRVRNGGKISPFQFLCAVCTKAIDGGCSLGNITTTLSMTVGESISKQGVWKRMTPAASTFFLLILQYIIGEKLNSATVLAKELITFFPRILLQDSCVIALHKSLFKYYPGSANQNGNCSSLKVQAVYNILDSTFTHFNMTSFRQNDQAAAGKIDFLKKGDLLIRDLGYFSTKAFAKINSLGAFFISRLKFGVHIYGEKVKIDPKTKKETAINLLGLLRGRDEIDMNVRLSASMKLPVRLVGVRLPKDVANKRRREAKENRDKKLKPSQEHLNILSWSLYITNIPKETWSVKTIILAYSLRWRIEIIFKSWKSCLNFDLKGKMSVNQVNLLLYSRLIMITVISAYYYPRFEDKIFKKTGRNLSLIKFVDLIVSSNEGLWELFESKNTHEKKLARDILSKNITYEQRKRSNYARELQALADSAMNDRITTNIVANK